MSANNNAGDTNMIRHHFPSSAVMLAIAAAGLAAGSAAEARSIRVDNGGGAWEQNFGNVLDQAGDSGIVTLPFEFFGTSTLYADPRGFVRPDAANSSSVPSLFPLIFAVDAPNPASFFLTFDWGGRDRDCSTDPGLCTDGERQFRDQPTSDSVPIDTDETTFADDAFRVTWQVTDAQDNSSAYQLVVWKLFSEDYVVEFNYDQITGDLDESYLGYVLDSLNSFGVLASGYGTEYIDLFNCNTSDGCAAGDNFVLPGFPSALRDVFLADTFGEPVTGRALFYIDASDTGTPVPEPGSVGLMLLGVAGLAGAARRRRNAQA